MPPATGLLEPEIQTRVVARRTGNPPRVSATVRAALRGIDRAFDQTFSLFDVRTGELVHRASDWLDCDLYARLTQCEEIARRGRAEVLDEFAPLLMLAIPLHCNADSSDLLAISTFLTEPVDCLEQITAAADAFGVDSEQAFHWSRSRTLWNTHAITQVSTLLQSEREQNKQIAALNLEQLELLHSVVRALVVGIDAKDPFTCGHSERVARLAVRIARHMGCTNEELEAIHLAGLLHDIGKIGIDDCVLRKPSSLSASEYEHIKSHVELGCRILAEIKQLEHVLPVVLHHHEAWNGEGYPHGLTGSETPLLARIVAVADSVDAMASDRPYRKGLSHEYLNQVLRQGSGCQWDPAVVRAYFEIREVAAATCR